MSFSCLTSFYELYFIFGISLEILLQLALCRDEATQEHAVETIAEMLTVPIIQVCESKKVYES